MYQYTRTPASVFVLNIIRVYSYATSSHLLLSPPKVLQGNCILPQLFPRGFPRYVQFPSMHTPCTRTVRDVRCDMFMCPFYMYIHWALGIGLGCHCCLVNCTCTRVVRFPLHVYSHLFLHTIVIKIHVNVRSIQCQQEKSLSGHHGG